MKTAPDFSANLTHEWKFNLSFRGEVCAAVQARDAEHESEKATLRAEMVTQRKVIDELRARLGEAERILGDVLDGGHAEDWPDVVAYFASVPPQKEAAPPKCGCGCGALAGTCHVGRDAIVAPKEMPVPIGVALDGVNARLDALEAVHARFVALEKREATADSFWRHEPRILALESWKAEVLVASAAPQPAARGHAFVPGGGGFMVAGGDGSPCDGYGNPVCKICHRLASAMIHVQPKGETR